MDELHIGDLIGREMKMRKIDIAELAKRMGRTKQAIYHLLEQKATRTDVLVKLSMALGVNLFIKASAEAHLGKITGRDEDEVKREIEIRLKYEKIIEALRIENGVLKEVLKGRV